MSEVFFILQGFRTNFWKFEENMNFVSIRARRQIFANFFRFYSDFIHLSFIFMDFMKVGDILTRMILLVLVKFFDRFPILGFLDMAAQW